jgi:hypothetical protein
MASRGPEISLFPLSTKEDQVFNERFWGAWSTRNGEQPQAEDSLWMIRQSEEVSTDQVLWAG